jgi:hypothetical protein
MNLLAAGQATRRIRARDLLLDIRQAGAQALQLCGVTAPSA